MNKIFKVGKVYECANPHIGSIKVLDRMKSKILVTDGEENWTMVIKKDADGDEFVQKNDVSLNLKGIYTYSADWEI